MDLEGSPFLLEFLPFDLLETLVGALDHRPVDEILDLFTLLRRVISLIDTVGLGLVLEVEHLGNKLTSASVFLLRVIHHGWFLTRCSSLIVHGGYLLQVPIGLGVLDLVVTPIVRTPECTHLSGRILEVTIVPHFAIGCVQALLLEVR